MPELYCIKLRASVYFFILTSHLTQYLERHVHSPLPARKERKEGRKEETEEEKVKEKEKEGGGRKGGGRQEINYYRLFQRMVQNRTCFHWATQSQLQWMPGSFGFPWPNFYSLHFRFFPFPDFVFFC